MLDFDGKCIFCNYTIHRCYELLLVEIQISSCKKKQHAVRLQLNHLEWKELPSRIAETKSSK